MKKVKLTNQTNGVLVLPDMYNQNHVNLMPKQSKEFTEMEYGFYKKMAEVRIRNGLLKLEYVEYPDAAKVEIPAEPVSAQVEEEKPEFDDAGYDEAEANLAGFEEEEKPSEQAPKIEKSLKKKKKNQNKKS